MDRHFERRLRATLAANPSSALRNLMIVETAVDHYCMEQEPMFIDVCPFLGLHQGERATQPIAHFSARLAHWDVSNCRF
jgi:hypothetical protein